MPRACCPRAAQKDHSSSRCALQALRDNGRLALDDLGFAQHLWEASGLQQAFMDIEAQGRHACGLNANIRLYRHAPPLHGTYGASHIRPFLSREEWWINYNTKMQIHAGAALRPAL